VYQASLNHSAVPLSRLEPLLAPEERAWVRRLHFDGDRRRYTAGRLWLRWLLAAHLGATLAEIRFRPGPYGKPALTSPGDVRGLRFSASYSGDLAVFALARATEVGVDVERVRADVDVEQIAASFFARGEREALRRLAADVRVRAFFTCWTRKEAYVKALGVGLSLPLDSFDVSPGLEAGRVPDRYSITGPAGEWSLGDVEVAAGYTAAIAVEGCTHRVPRAASEPRSSASSRSRGTAVATASTVEAAEHGRRRSADRDGCRAPPRRPVGGGRGISARRLPRHRVRGPGGGDRPPGIELRRRPAVLADPRHR
jgi:4'-phosphopantetheinyl transferase